MFRREIKAAVLFLFCLFHADVPVASTPQTADSLRTSILALDSAWNRALQDLQQKKQGNILTDSEKQEYGKFITFLSTRIYDYCYQLRTQGGEQAVAGLPCPAGSSDAGGAEISMTPTRQEQVAELDASLSRSLEEFDEQILKEEQKIASRLPAERETGTGPGTYGSTSTGGMQGAGGYGGGGTAGTGGYSGGGMSGAGGQNTRGAGQAGTAPETGGMQSDRGTGSSASGNTGRGQNSGSSAGGAGAGTGQPGSTPQQSGGKQVIEAGYDDIVARQLREAAERETDPELREKLWEEYRKYKQGIR